MQTTLRDGLAWHALHFSLACALASELKLAWPCLLHMLPKPSHMHVDSWSYSAQSGQHPSLNHLCKMWPTWGVSQVPPTDPQILQMLALCARPLLVLGYPLCSAFIWAVGVVTWPWCICRWVDLFWSRHYSQNPGVTVTWSCKLDDKIYGFTV